MKLLFLLAMLSTTTLYCSSQCFYNGYAYNVGTELTFDGAKHKCQCIIENTKLYQPCAARWVLSTPPPTVVVRKSPPPISRPAASPPTNGYSQIANLCALVLV
jgi:hypothetical protein